MSQSSRRRRLGAVLVAAPAVAALVVLGVATLGHGRKAPAAETPPPVSFSPVPSTSATAAMPTASTPPSSEPQPTTGAPCPVGRVEATLPTAAPRDLTWVHGLREPMPVSPTYGPLRRDDVGLPTCFSHSPTGAVIAAWSINASLFTTHWSDVLATQIAHTTGYPRLVTQLQAEPPDGSPGTTSPAGFEIIAADQDAVTLELVLRDNTTSALVGCPVTVAWEGDDWQLAPRPDGTVTTPTCPAVTAGTFIAWGI